MTEITDKFINELKNNKKLCAHLHVSLQSGSDRILKLMNRKYTKDEYFSNIMKIKEARPDINLTTDVIVGFPGETEENFLECIDYCKKVGFSKIHVFPYSVREGTKAATMPSQLPNSVKKERSRQLIKIDEDLQLAFNKRFVGRTLDVLIEEVFEDYSVGHTENFLKVIVKKKLKENTSYKVKITKANVIEVEGDLI